MKYKLFINSNDFGKRNLPKKHIIKRSNMRMLGAARGMPPPRPGALGRYNKSEASNAHTNS
jgi:hypothetical protein